MFIFLIELFCNLQNSFFFFFSFRILLGRPRPLFKLMLKYERQFCCFKNIPVIRKSTGKRLLATLLFKVRSTARSSHTVWNHRKNKLMGCVTVVTPIYVCIKLLRVIKTTFSCNIKAMQMLRYQKLWSRHITNTSLEYNKYCCISSFYKF